MITLTKLKRCPPYFASANHLNEMSPNNPTKTSFQKISKKKIFPKNLPQNFLPKRSHNQKCFLLKTWPNQTSSPLRVPWRWVKLEGPNQRHPSCLPRPSCPGPGGLGKLLGGSCHTLRSKKIMGVSLNGGTPKSSILTGFSIINHPFWGTPIFENTHMACRYQFWLVEGPYQKKYVGTVLCYVLFQWLFQSLETTLKRKIGETPASPRDLLPVQSFGLIFPCNKVLMVDPNACGCFFVVQVWVEMLEIMFWCFCWWSSVIYIRKGTEAVAAGVVITCIYIYICIISLWLSYDLQSMRSLSISAGISLGAFSWPDDIH